MALMARQLALLFSLMAALQAAESPVIEKLHVKERALRVTEELSSASDDGRRLQGNNMCRYNLLMVFENALMNNWYKCVNEKSKEKNMNIAGARAEMNVECWCEENMEATLSSYGCCESTYQDYCKAICPPLLDNCTTAEAQKCIEDCPALCYEKDYAPEFCDSSCTGCEKYVLCITEHSRNKTLSGHVEHQPICSENEFYESQEWKDWFDCYSAYPKRTHWARHNAENYCYCNSSLKAAAERHHCCNAGWGTTICDEDCSNALNIDCEHNDAQFCLQHCKQQCSKLFREEMKQECRDECMEPSSTCEKYRICEPAGPFTFHYVCDDGSKPNVRGCCAGKFGNPVCPSLCTSATGHHPSLSAAGLRFTNSNMECSCEGCPASVAHIRQRYKQTLEESLFETGNLEIARIARQRGLTGPNRKMQELLLERDAKIIELFDLHPGLPDDAWQVQMDSAMTDYAGKFQAEANRYAKYGDPVVDPVSEESNNIVLIIVLASSGVVALVLVAIIVMLCMRAKSQSQQMPAQRPRDGDSNVVMGRPVVPGTGSEAVAAEGAPVTTDEKAQDNTKV